MSEPLQIALVVVGAIAGIGWVWDLYLQGREERDG